MPEFHLRRARSGDTCQCDLTSFCTVQSSKSSLKEMQAGPKAPGSSQAPVKIYNAVYSSVQVSIPYIYIIRSLTLVASIIQVYECMVRGIAVMRRRNDSYVNATQILKVAGVDKGRRTKILEKEILPGKHEIVQGGYGKYQGTW